MTTALSRSTVRCFHHHRPFRISRPYHPRPLGAFYDLLLSTPSPEFKHGPPPPPPSDDGAPSSPTPTPNIPAPLTNAESRARVVFGSRLAGPGKRTQGKKGTTVAGVYIPPKPIEPDNCCMSGCVNCVLSQFVEELEEWKAAKREAGRRVKAGRDGDEDGAPVEGLWDGFEDIPVGLRAFMETERRLAKEGKAKGERAGKVKDGKEKEAGEVKDGKEKARRKNGKGEKKAKG